MIFYHKNEQFKAERKNINFVINLNVKAIFIDLMK